MEVVRVDEFDEEVISEKLIEIYEDTSEWLCFSSSLHPDFFSREDIQEKLADLCERGVAIRILLDDDVPIEERREELPWLFGESCVEIRQSRQDIPHRVISDNSDLRLEKPHDIRQKGAANIIALDAPDAFREPYMEEFEGWWEEASSVEGG